MGRLSTREDPGSSTLSDGRLDQAMQALGIEFRDPDLLKLALIHSSYLNEQPESRDARFEQSNERLEFLGDALLDFIAADYLYHRYPALPEGDLTVFRAALVRTETLAGWALELGLEDLLYLAAGEYGNGHTVGNRVLAGAFEAVLAAIYQDQGIDTATNFLTRLFDRDVEQIISTRQLTNYKGLLQERIQSRYQTTPEYEVVRETGPAHSRYFIVQVRHRGETLGEGGGASKRIAEQAAARDALERLKEKGD